MCLEAAFRALLDETMKVDKALAVASCSVVIMTDRPATLKALSAKAQVLGCDSVMAEHKKGNSFSSEHGPFAGLGFFGDERSSVGTMNTPDALDVFGISLTLPLLFQDLAVAQHATGTVIKMGWSMASNLLAALMAFRRTRVQSRAALVTCTLDRSTQGCNCQ